MSLLPLPSRLPARKHVLAAVFGLLGLMFMIGAVLTASGLALPFTSRGVDNVRAGSIVVDAPTTTSTPLAAVGPTTTGGVSRSRALDPVAEPGPAPTTPTSRPVTTAPPTSTTLPTVPPPPTLLPPLGGLGQGGLGRG